MIKVIKKYFGLLWMIMALMTAYVGYMVLGIPKLTSGKQEDLVFGIIVAFILLPIIVGGLMMFGYYAWTDEYSDD
jgi:hypothetical protein